MSESMIVGLKLREFSSNNISETVEVVYGDAKILYLKTNRDSDMYEAELLIIPLSLPTIVLRKYIDRADGIETLRLYVFTSMGWIETHVKG